MKGDPRSHGPWERTAPPAPPSPPLAEAVEADVVVIGTGSTGLSATLHFAEADLPLPLTGPRAEPFRFLKEAFYEVGAQAAHLKQAVL